MRPLTCVCNVCAQSSALRFACWRLQLEAAIYLFQSAVAVRDGGSFAAELQSAASASAVVPLWPHVPIVCFVSAAVAAMDRSKLPAARPGRPQHQY